MACHFEGFCKGSGDQIGLIKKVYVAYRFLKGNFHHEFPKKSAHINEMSGIGILSLENNYFEKKTCNRRAPLRYSLDQY